MSNTQNGIELANMSAFAYAKSAYEEANKLEKTNKDSANKKYSEAYTLFKKVSKNDSNYADAQYYIGLMLYNGQGIEENHKLAVDAYNTSAEFGNPDSQNIMGLFYIHGQEGLNMDAKKAFDLFTKAAKQGHKDGMVNLGVCYAKGVGVTPNMEEAATWLDMAVKAGDKEADDSLRTILEALKSQAIAQEKAKNDQQAMRTLMRLQGKGVKGAREAMLGVHAHFVRENIRKHGGKRSHKRTARKSKSRRLKTRRYK